MEDYLISLYFIIYRFICMIVYDNYIVSVYSYYFVVFIWLFLMNFLDYFYKFLKYVIIVGRYRLCRILLNFID